MLSADGASGEVTTILGSVYQAADAKDFQARMTPRLDDPRPCLNSPQGMAWLGDSLYLTDQGHHVY